jgi:hypothetical protein
LPRLSRGNLVGLLRFEETGPITLSRDGDKLVAEMRGNLPALLEVSEELYNRGAGSPVRLFPTSLLLRLVARMVS